MEVKCELITPIFIGCGEEYSQLDYFIEDGFAHIIDLEKAIADLDDLEKVNEISRLIISNTTNNRLNLNAKDILKSVGLNPYDYVIRKIKCEIKSDSKTRVKKFISQNNKYYIPGSSIKGAIRTAYLFNYYDKNLSELLKILDNRDIKLHEKGKELEKNAISKNIPEDFFKYLKISDSLNLKGEFKFIHTRRWNYRKRKLNIPINMEGMIKGTFSINIKIEDGFFKNINKKLKTNYNPKDEGEMFNILKNLCNNFSKTVVEFELKKNNSYYIERIYEKLLSDINKDGAIYLNLGFGGGFLNKTIYPLLWKNDENLIHFKKIKSLFVALSGGNKNLKNAWLRANSYLDFPTTKTVYAIYSKQDRRFIPKLPMGWIKMELVE
ncbi:CRISPR-associated protein, Csm5 [Methanocaldococcus bathoardescens]|uniref:CRISPR system Cms protein Csm5 n=1 Tax=Methanocaldococcus bathoardescens TaxID=1301915 RepID=A0A076LHD2_9EURY|nr:type III-A CRISPR-associated RAMP protein Csm5 [Methanocaldococcus bathoardescens]AIJ06327.1 CRISPR-associated protein, Csm5 [Methanocaldococcus bathoardescens]